MYIISTRFGYGVLITPTIIQQVTGLDIEAASREHQYIKTKNGYQCEDVSIEQFCEHFQFDILDVQEFIEAIPLKLELNQPEERFNELFEEEEDEFDLLIKEIEQDCKYNLATIAAKDDLGRHQATSAI